MNILERIHDIESINMQHTSDDTYFLMPTDNTNSYYGKNHKGNLVFIICPKNGKIKKRFKLTTNDLLLEVNVASEFNIAGTEIKMLAHILTCTSDDRTNQIAFVRLCEAFKDSNLIKDEDVIKLFNAFVNLFSDKAKSSFIELQGLFAELFVMRYFEQKNTNLYQYWQSEDKRKHDFCISSKKRIEVKSTLKDIRLHHFLHEQLLTELHDVKIISLVMKKSDAGVSLFDIVSGIRQSPFASYALLLHIEQKLRNCPIDEQKLLVFDEQLLYQHLKIFEAKDIPHFNEKQPDGVFHAEYDSDLTNAKEFSINKFILWVNQNDSQQLSSPNFIQ